MGRIVPIPEEVLVFIRRELRKQGYTMVRNRKTGSVFVRRINVAPPSVASESQSQCRSEFLQRSHQASQWLKSNNAEACPPDGTPAYKAILEQFHGQDKIKQLLNFVMTRVGELQS